MTIPAAPAAHPAAKPGPAPSASALVAPYTAADRIRWAALVLVFFAALLNYLDRQAIALLKPALSEDLGWSDLDYAHIVSGFQIATILSMLAVGWFVDRVGVRVGYALGVGGWSLTQMAHAFVTTVSGFFWVRALLGLTEAVNTPAAVKTVSSWFRGEDRSLALGIMNVAPNIGAVATPLIVPAIAIAFGWKAAFLITGAVGAIWLVFWWMLPKPPAALRSAPAIEAAPVEPPAAAAAPTGDEPAKLTRADYKRLLADRRTWAVALAKFLSDFVWVFLFFWAPDILAKQYGLNMAGTSLPVALVFGMAAAGSFSAGLMSSRMLAGGRSYNLSRKTPMAIAAVLAIPVFTVATVDSMWLAASLLGLTLAAHQMFSTSVFGLATDIFPARLTGLIIGFGATFGSLSGLLMNEFTGYVLHATGSYAPMLALCAGAKIIAWWVVHVLVPNIDRTREAMLAAEAA
ncbi:MFS transporter [bacterium]|nr:MFS transporter [bacterium]